MGCFHVQLCKHRGAQVIVIEPDKERREIALKIGADCVINPNEQNQLNEVMKITDNLGAEIVVNTVSFPNVAVNAMSLLKRGGKFILYSGLYPNNPIETNLGEIHSKEIKVMGSFSSRSIDFTRTIKLQKTHIIDVESFIHKIVPLSSIQEAFESTLNSFRVVVDMEK